MLGLLTLLAPHVLEVEWYNVLLANGLSPLKGRGILSYDELSIQGEDISSRAEPCSPVALPPPTKLDTAAPAETKTSGTDGRSHSNEDENPGALNANHVPSMTNAAPKEPTEVSAGAGSGASPSASRSQLLCDELIERKETPEPKLVAQLEAVLHADAELSATAAKLLGLEVSLFEKLQLLKEGH